MQTEKKDRTFFLCVSSEIFNQLLEQFPKSKFILQKRSLERRKVFTEHLEKLESFLEIKKQKMEKITLKRLKYEAKLAKKAEDNSSAAEESKKS